MEAMTHDRGKRWEWSKQWPYARVRGGGIWSPGERLSEDHTLPMTLHDPPVLHDFLSCPRHGRSTVPTYQESRKEPPLFTLSLRGARLVC